MKRRLFIERAAEADLLETAAYIREKRPASAPQFVTAAREAFDLLAEPPGIGRPYQTEHLRLQGLRVWQVKGFEKYLIFYRAGKQTVYVERVLYGGRNLDWILGGED